MLNPTQIKALKPKEKNYKISDEKGLYLLIHKNGSKYFRFKYRFNTKTKEIALGVFPEISLKQARQKRDELRIKVREGADPAQERKLKKLGIQGGTFKEVAEDFLASKKPLWSESSYKRISRIFNKDVYPIIGDMVLMDIKALDILPLLRLIADRGALESAHRTKQFIGQAIKYGIATGRAERDVTADLKGALPSPIKTNFAAITDPVELGKLLSDIDSHKGGMTVRTALKIQPLLFLRPSNLVSMRWENIDFEAKLMLIPAEQMKMKLEHFIPLSTQVIALLEEIKPFTGSSEWVFKSDKKQGHIDKETPSSAIRRKGYAGKHTAHGFRTTASTMLHEQGFNSDMIERQLAHAEGNKIKAAYCRAEYMPDRIRMMQHWADFLDSLRAGSNVIPINFNEVRKQN